MTHFNFSSRNYLSGVGDTSPCAHMNGTYTLQDYFPIKVVNTLISEAQVGVTIF